MSVYHEPDLRYDRRRTAIIAVLGLALAVVVLACIYFLFNPLVNAAPVNTSVSTIYADPNRTIGKNILLSGKVATVVNNGAFTVVDPSTATGPQVLVVSTKLIPPVTARPAHPALMPGDIVTVEGPLRRLATNDRIAGVDTAGPEYQPYAGSPVVYANTVTPPGGTAAVVTPHAGTAPAPTPGR